MSASNDDGNIEIRGYTPLHEAVYFGKADDVQRILDSGAVSVNARTERKETPIHYALCHGKVNCIRPLLKAGADVNRRTLSMGSTPLTMGVMQCPTTVIEEFLKICKEENIPIDLNKGNFFGETALHFAVTHNKRATVKVLLDAGANIDAVTFNGHTPYHIATEENHKEILDLLKQRGAVQSIAPPKVKPPVNLPSFISSGYLKDESMMEHELKFGGALFQNCLPVFYLGKKPRDGLCVEISVRFKKPIKDIEFSWLRGMLFQVGEQTVKAVVKLNCDHEGRIPQLAGNWIATLGFVPNMEFPWILTEFTKAPEDLYEHVLARSQLVAQARGRKYKLAPSAEHKQKAAQRCMIPKGVYAGDHSACGEEPLIISEINVNRQTGQVVVRFENGEDQIMTGAKAHKMVSNMLAMKQQSSEIETAVNFI